MGDDALRISVVDSKYTYAVDQNRENLHSLTLAGTAYEIERLAAFVENEHNCHVILQQPDPNAKERVDATFQILRIVEREDDEYTVEEWREHYRSRRYRCYQKIQREGELRNVDYKVRKQWERKAISDQQYMDYCQDFNENAKLYLHKYINYSDENFNRQFIYVYDLLKKNESDEEDEDEDEEVYDEN
jgi:hypothetical protein